MVDDGNPGRGGWQGVHEERLLDEQLVPAVAPALIGAGAAPVRAADLLALPSLHDGDSSNWRHWAAAHGAPLRPKAADRHFGDYALAVDAALNGFGVVLWKSALHRPDSTLHAFSSLATTGPLADFLLRRSTANHAPPVRVADRLIVTARA